MLNACSLPFKDWAHSSFDWLFKDEADFWVNCDDESHGDYDAMGKLK